MIYLDYSSTTPPRKEVLDSFVESSERFIGNANSLHKLGLDARKLMEKAEEQVASLFSVLPSEIIFTSSASEANNMALKGIAQFYQTRGKHIVTTKLEHSSILETCTFLESQGFIIDYVPVDSFGQVHLEELEKVLRKDTILVSIHQVNSEVGIIQDVSKIGSFLKKNYPKVFFHVDGTQSVGKMPVCLDNIDLFTCSAHKFYGLKGIACLIKKKNVNLVPLIHGGKSQTDFRSGTPAVSLMVSFAKALRLALEDFEEKYQDVKEKNLYLRKELEKIPEVVINSPRDALPHILNLSIPKIKSETMLHALEQEEIYISTKTACSRDSSLSLSLDAMGRAKEISSTSIRISLSYLTTKEELENFLKILKTKIKELNFQK